MLKSIMIRVSLEFLILNGGQFQFQNGNFSNFVVIDLQMI